MKKRLWFYMIIAIEIGGSFLFSRFWQGFIIGSAVSTLLFETAGRAQIKKIEKLVDKYNQDKIQNDQTV